MTWQAWLAYVTQAMGIRQLAKHLWFGCEDLMGKVNGSEIGRSGVQSGSRYLVSLYTPYPIIKGKPRKLCGTFVYSTFSFFWRKGQGSSFCQNQNGWRILVRRDFCVFWSTLCVPNMYTSISIYSFLVKMTLIFGILVNKKQESCPVWIKRNQKISEHANHRDDPSAWPFTSSTNLTR